MVKKILKADIIINKKKNEGVNYFINHIAFNITANRIKAYLDEGCGIIFSKIAINNVIEYENEIKLYIQYNSILFTAVIDYKNSFIILYNNFQDKFYDFSEGIILLIKLCENFVIIRLKAGDEE